MKDKVNDIHNEIKNEFDIKEANELIEILKANNETTLVDFFAQHHVSDKVFKNIDTLELGSAILNATNKQLFNFTETLSERYKSVNIGEFLFDDFQILNDVKNHITAELIKFKIQPQSFLLKELIKTLEKVCEHLNNTKK